jgi:hypothetical protein
MDLLNGFKKAKEIATRKFKNISTLYEFSELLK